jgi:ABC-type lipopolysaccharide export system ATPase subunit
MLAVRDAVRLVFQTQLENAPEENIVEARRLLNEITAASLVASITGWVSGGPRSRSAKAVCRP